MTAGFATRQQNDEVKGKAALSARRATVFVAARKG